MAVAPKQDGNNYQPAGTVLLYTVFVTSGVVNSDTATLRPRAAGQAAAANPKLRVLVIVLAPRFR